MNELTWWEFMKQTGVIGKPIPTRSVPTPDFETFVPIEFYVEITTLNVSESDKKEMGKGASVHLDHQHTLSRTLLKLMGQKNKQFLYASERHKPCALVLFDYTTWSGYGVEFFKVLADFLFGEQKGFHKLSPELSALILIERKVFDGRIALSLQRSAIYYNPHTKNVLPFGIWPSLNQFSAPQTVARQLGQGDWVWL